MLYIYNHSLAGLAAGSSPSISLKTGHLPQEMKAQPQSPKGGTRVTGNWTAPLFILSQMTPFLSLGWLSASMGAQRRAKRHSGNRLRNGKSWEGEWFSSPHSHTCSDLKIGIHSGFKQRGMPASPTSRAPDSENSAILFFLSNLARNSRTQVLLSSVANRKLKLDGSFRGGGLKKGSQDDGWRF